jgi:DNA-binding NtrC family response regulator
VDSLLQKSVVIVDDVPSYAELLGEMIADHVDARIDAFARPLDALAALPDLDVGIVITDYCMPQLNGAQFIAKASLLVPGIPFLLITGNPPAILNRDELRGLTALKAVLHKPFGWRDLTREIIRHWPEGAVLATPAATSLEV